LNLNPAIAGSIFQRSHSYISFNSIKESIFFIKIIKTQETDL